MPPYQPRAIRAKQQPCGQRSLHPRHNAFSLPLTTATRGLSLSLMTHDSANITLPKVATTSLNNIQQRPGHRTVIQLHPRQHTPAAGQGPYLHRKRKHLIASQSQKGETPASAHRACHPLRHSARNHLRKAVCQPPDITTLRIRPNAPHPAYKRKRGKAATNATRTREGSPCLAVTNSTSPPHASDTVHGIIKGKPFTQPPDIATLPIRHKASTPCLQA